MSILGILSRDIAVLVGTVLASISSYGTMYPDSRRGFNLWRLRRTPWTTPHHRCRR